MKKPLAPYLFSSLLVVVLALWAPGGAVPAQAASCSFQLGFADLAALLPDVVGQCTDGERHAPNGDALQPTTGGLLVWRKVDNWTAFTDGATTWINGPAGLQSRANGDRFDWETQLTGVLRPGQTWSQGGLDLTVEHVDVATNGLVPSVTIFYSLHNGGDVELALSLDQQQGITVSDNQGTVYPLACCLATKLYQWSLAPGQSQRAFGQFQGNAAEPGVDMLTVTFQQVGPISGAQWSVPIGH